MYISYNPIYSRLYGNIEKGVGVRKKENEDAVERGIKAFFN